MAAYELIGKKLGHSFSKPIHEALGAYEYGLRELPDEAAVAEYLTDRLFQGCNVTIPYKQTVMPFCDEIDERARRIGAVNTLVNRDGRLYGYNTDYEGFAWMLVSRGISLAGRKVLLLGGGATAKTAAAVAQDTDAASVQVVGRQAGNEKISYEEAARQGDAEVIINTSPTGMYPHNGQVLIDLAAFPNLRAVADVVYNPLQTRLLWNARQLGLPAIGGLPMLVMQAVAAARLFTGRSFTENEAERILKDIYAKQANITLIGMPSCGKSKLGEALARQMKRDFVDLDAALVQKAGKSIPDIFAENGEEAFRRLETQVLAEQTALPGRVLSTGGGVVTRPENNYWLHQNGPVLFIDRPLEQLDVGGDRPLSHSAEAVEALYRQRLPLYKQAADATIDNRTDFMKAVGRMQEAFYEVLDP